MGSKINISTHAIGGKVSASISVKRRGQPLQWDIKDWGTRAGFEVRDPHPSLQQEGRV